MKILAILIVAVAATAGWIWQKPPYFIASKGMPADQSALAHRDSAYASSTWVASVAENFLQLRFFDRVEGGVCLRPSWAEMRAMAAQDPRLQHLVPSGEIPRPAPAEKTWKLGELPDPGTLTTNKYITMFASGVLLNERLMTAAGGDPRQAAPQVMVVGLGSGTGIAYLAHHFPKSKIVVVDIDRVVIDLVRDHYPLLRWLEEQGRVELVVRDARQYVRSEGRKGTRWDLVILDAYTSGSTIPPHLMTREFYAECAAALTEGGIVLSNIIGSYEPTGGTGTKHLVLGGAIRSMVAAGLTSVHNIPIVQQIDPAKFDRRASRNNIVLASKAQISPLGAPAAWERLKGFTLYPEFRTRAQGETRFTTATLGLVRDRGYDTALVPFSAVEAVEPGLRASFKPMDNDFAVQTGSNDPGTVEKTLRAVAKAYAGGELPLGWSGPADGRTVVLSEMDWVDHARKEWNAAVKYARDTYQHGSRALVGEGEDRSKSIIPDAPLFTDARPNADIFNGG